MDVVEPTTRAAEPAQIPSTVGPTPHELDATLDHLARLCERLETAEQRFKRLTDECEGVLHGLVAVDRHHSGAVANLQARLGEWCNLEGKLLQESARRIEQFERGVGHEWLVIRQMHEEPIAEMRDQAAQLRLACLEAARLARFRLDSAEHAYTAYASDLERRMGEWRRELLAVAGAKSLTDGNPSAPPADGSVKPYSSAVEPWPLEGVAQLHQELRTAATPGSPATAAAHPAVVLSPAAPDGGLPASQPVASATKGLRAALSWPPSRRVALSTLAAAAIVLTLGVIAWRGATPPAVRSVPAPRSTQAPVSPRPAPSEAVNVGADAASVEPGRAAARREAERVGAMVEILAAPDLRRYALAGVDAASARQPYGQVLWSRSRGLATSASRLAALPAGKVYRLWIVPEGVPVAAGELTPDAAGRASLVLPGPLTLPLPVTIRVTIEDGGQPAGPRGPVYLVRVPLS